MKEEGKTERKNYFRTLYLFYENFPHHKQEFSRLLKENWFSCFSHPWFGSDCVATLCPPCLKDMGNTGHTKRANGRQ